MSKATVKNVISHDESEDENVILQPIAQQISKPSPKKVIKKIINKTKKLPKPEQSQPSRVRVEPEQDEQSHLATGQETNENIVTDTSDDETDRFIKKSTVEALEIDKICERARIINDYVGKPVGKGIVLSNPLEIDNDTIVPFSQFILEYYYKLDNEEYAERFNPLFDTEVLKLAEKDRSNAAKLEKIRKNVIKTLGTV